MAKALYDELGFDEGREGVAAYYVTEEDVESFLESDGDFVETKDRFIFPLIFENKAKTVSYSGISQDDIYDERLVNGETALVNVGGEKRIERSHTKEIQWGGADSLIGK